MTARENNWNGLGLYQRGSFEAHPVCFYNILTINKPCVLRLLRQQKSLFCFWGTISCLLACLVLCMKFICVRQGTRRERHKPRSWSHKEEWRPRLEKEHDAKISLLLVFFLVSASFVFVGFSLLFFVVAMTTENWEGFNGESENGVGRVGF